MRSQVEIKLARTDVAKPQKSYCSVEYLFKSEIATVLLSLFDILFVSVWGVYSIKHFG